MNSHNKIQFESYVKSYLQNYFNDKNLINNDFNISFYDYLLNQVSANSIKTCLTLFFAFKKDKLLQGASSEERYRYFDRISASREFHNLVNEMYPLLKLRLDKILSNHIKNYKYLKARIENDREDIYKNFGFYIDKIEKCNITYGMSDYHRGLKSVYIIEYRDKKIIYKPRSGKIDEYWEKFINWFNSKKPGLKLNTIKTLDKGEYHWQEYIYIINHAIQSRKLKDFTIE